MRSSNRLRGKDRDSPRALCSDNKECTCVLCYFKYVHRIWFASQCRLLVMYAAKDQELFTTSIAERFATSAEDASACRDRFLLAHDIVYNPNKGQKRIDWSVKNSNARKFGKIDDLIYMWYNMDMTLPEEAYHRAISRAPTRHHPLPYLPECLRLKLYPSLAAKTDGIRQTCRFLGAVPPHPTFIAQLDGRPVELSASIKMQTQSCRRLSIEVWRKFLDEEKAVKKVLKGDDLKIDAIRRLRSWIQSELQPVYMRPVQSTDMKPEVTLRGASLRAHELDYLNHDADPGPYKYNKAISGTVTVTTLITLFQRAEMGPNTIFLDVGSGLGEPMIAAAAGFKVRLSLGLEVHKNRVQESLRSMIEKDVSRVFPIHVSVEEICHFDPVTHLYCYTNGMDSCARNCLRESILSSKSVQFVMTDRKDLLRYPDEGCPFDVQDTVTMTMASSKNKKRTFYILRRVRPFVQQPIVNFHPIFALPLYMLRFDCAHERAFLNAYMRMLSRSSYKPRYFCGANPGDSGTTSSLKRGTKRKRSTSMTTRPMPELTKENCFYSPTALSLDTVECL